MKAKKTDKIERMKFVKAGVEVDRKLWFEFRTIALSKGIKLKYAITTAIKLWVEKAKSE